MALNPIEGLASLLAAAGLGGGPSDSQITSLSEQLQNLKSVNDSIAQQQAAVLAQATSGGSSGGGTTSTSLLSGIGGLGITPLIAGLTSLFDGGSDQGAAPALNRFVQAASINADAGFSEATGAEVFGVDKASGNSPRAITQPPAQITVQVQAMDSQSFLDRSQDIANAVRQAMLETTVLNDVIRGL